MTNSVMFTVDEAGTELGLTRPQVYRRIDQGQLRAVRARRGGKQCWLITAESLEAFRAGGVDLGPEESPELLRVPAAARLLGLSPEYVRRLVNRGELAAKRADTPNSQIHIPRSAIDTYLRGGPTVE